MSNESKYSVLIYGATGLVGSLCVERLLASSNVDQVMVLARANQSKTKNSRLHWVQTDFSQLESIELPFQPDSVICTLGTTLRNAGSKQRFLDIEQSLVLKVADWLKQLAVKRFIYLSSMGADPNSRSFYLQTKGAIEHALMALNFNQLVIVQPSLLLGKRREFRFGELLAQWVMPKFAALLPGQYRAVDAQHVASCIVDAALYQHAEPFARLTIENQQIHDGVNYDQVLDQMLKTDSINLQ